MIFIYIYCRPIHLYDINSHEIIWSYEKLSKFPENVFINVRVNAQTTIACLGSHFYFCAQNALVLRGLVRPEK